MRIAVKAGLLLIAVYVLLSTAFLAVAHLPPAQFAAVMARTPRILMFVLPFEPLWIIARAGKLRVGDAAPDFDLPARNNQDRIRLSSFRGSRPVVLVFGSYT